jgi:hypothetical protein
MTVFCTYCSAEKEATEGLLPAILRYRSERVERIHAAARAAGGRFYILSGEYGLLAPNEPIPYYDHLLVADEVEAHAFKLTEQIEQYSITQIVFFTFPVSQDEKLAPYHAALRLACTMASTRLSFVEIDFA